MEPLDPITAQTTRIDACCVRIIEYADRGDYDAAIEEARAIAATALALANALAAAKKEGAS
jgi:predicted AAA+ superfamily ATPase